MRTDVELACLEKISDMEGTDSLLLYPASFLASSHTLVPCINSVAQGSALFLSTLCCSVRLPAHGVFCFLSIQPTEPNDKGFDLTTLRS